MKAMVLAAGLGTRLRPLTNDRPKALVEINGRPMLEIVLARLRAEGIWDVVINVHSFADSIIEYLRANHNFGMRLEISREDALLDTGGGLKKAARFFMRTAGDEPFLVHNVDVVSTVDLGALIREHSARKVLATLAVQHRSSSRCLLFDEQLQLCGRRSPKEKQDEIVRGAASLQALAFSGIHVLSPQIFGKMTEEGAFSIVDCYLRLASMGETIVGVQQDEAYWRDLGKPESVRAAAEELKARPLPY